MISIGKLSVTCTEPGCEGRDICCQEREHVLSIRAVITEAS